MTLAIIETKRTLPYAPADLCALVSDIRAYPRFIPWLKRIDVLRERTEEGTWIAVARADVGWRALSERFTTEVRAAQNRIDVALVEGPFKRLENRWRFLQAPGGETLVDFYVAFEFRNPILQALATLNREIAAGRIMAAFEQEAARRFAKRPTA